MDRNILKEFICMGQNGEGIIKECKENSNSCFREEMIGVCNTNNERIIRGCVDVLIENE